MSAFGGIKLDLEKYARMTHQMTIQSRPSTLGSLAHLTAKTPPSRDSGGQRSYMYDLRHAPGQIRPGDAEMRHLSVF